MSKVKLKFTEDTDFLWKFALYIVPVLLFLIIFFSGFWLEGGQQFALLAQSFVHGHLYVMHPLLGQGEDPVFYHGKVYWDDGPFPSVFLMPFTAIGEIFHYFFLQGDIKWALVLGIVFFIYKLARQLAYNIEDSWTLVLAFTLGSVFIGVYGVSSSWLFAQILNTFLIFWGLYEYFGHRRWWLLGTICGMIFLTRVTAVPLIIFFGLEALRLFKKEDISYKLKKLFQLGAPVVVAIFLMALYNYLRFHNPLNSGNEYQEISAMSANARSMGIFSLAHVPTNFYYAVLNGPMPVLRNAADWSLKYPFIKNDFYGMSIFITSPYLLNLFTHKWSSYTAMDRNLLIAALLSALFIFSYYGVGADQYGYRYSLDFLPELFLLFMIRYRSKNKHITKGMRALLLGSGIFNFYLVWPFMFT